jgi:hypothetical protein
MNKHIFNLIKIAGLICLIVVVGCNKDEEKNGSKLKVGMKHEGGIIAYVDGSGKHGMIAAPHDHDTLCYWGRAFTVCENLIIDGYDDWDLPNKDELNKLYENKNAIGGFTEKVYWSSTELENDGNGAWAQDFKSGNPGSAAKTSYRNVRAVRAF